MIENILEYSNENAVKESKHLHPTLRMVEKQMKGFPEELIMYVYHHLNGREDDAQSYLLEWENEQLEIRNNFYKVNELNNNNQILSNDNVIDVSTTGEHTSSNTISDDKE